MHTGMGAVPLLLLTIAVFASGWLLQTKRDTVVTPELIETSIVVENNLILFCEAEYYAEPIFLFGINMLARIATIASEQPISHVCENLDTNTTSPSKPLNTELRYLPSDPSGIYHYLRIGALQFSFDPITEQIFLHNAFDGTPQLFGTFR